MPTLYVTHPIYLEHLTPPGHPERPDRLRVIGKALSDPRFASLIRKEPSPVDETVLATAHLPEYITSIRDAAPSEGMVRVDADTALSPQSYLAATYAAGAACMAVDEVMTGKATNAFCADPPARPPRRGRPGDGLLPVQQRGHRGPARPVGPWRRTGGDRRLGRPSRQRNPGDRLVRPDDPLRLDPSDAALSGHRLAVGDRRRQHPQRAARSRLGRPGVPGSLHDHGAAGAEQFLAGSGHHLGRVRRALARPACQYQSQRGRLRLGDDGTHGDRRQVRRRPHRQRARGRL